MTGLKDALDALAAPFRWLDRQVQRGVDAASFVLSRRGFPKSIQTYTLEAIWVAGLVGANVARREWLAVAIWAVFAVLHVKLIHRWLREDTRAEESGMMTARDRDGAGANFATLLKMLFGAALLFSVVAIVRDGAGVSAAVRGVANAAALIETYLRRTPRNPPPARQTHTVTAPNAA